MKSTQQKEAARKAALRVRQSLKLQKNGISKSEADKIVENKAQLKNQQELIRVLNDKALRAAMGPAVSQVLYGVYRSMKIR